MKKKFKNFLLWAGFAFLCTPQVHAFCGFYVAKADATLFNKSSQVIVVRDGDRTVITMSSDYEGDVTDFAMVVPVPVVLQETDIRVVQQYIFQKFDAYTAPRLVEYWDPNPCYVYERKDFMMKADTKASGKGGGTLQNEQAKALGVTIEAKYTVGEYDILILSALESSGLKTWLTDNGYKIPAGADEVLQPYINDGMKFFVVKVNLEAQKALGLQTLRPLQIQFNTSQFMLPIRLGMANATGAQDMIVYTFTRKGRVETANYRTTLLPSNRDIPEFIQTDGLFGDFYKAVFERAWAREGKNAVLLEYAWDVSSRQSVKCDPCVTTPISFAELREAGIWWVDPGQSGGYTGDLFVTRLHVRYARKTFPQDLMFLNTSDQSNFQGRYVVHHPPKGKLDCDAGRRYKKSLVLRREKELQELAALTGWKTGKWASYVTAFAETGPGNKPIYDSPKLVSSNPASPADSQSTETVAANDTTVGTVGLVNEQESIATSNRFLDSGAVSSNSGIGKRTWLFILAGAILVAGILVRVIGRKPRNRPEV